MVNNILNQILSPIYYYMQVTGIVTGTILSWFCAFSNVVALDHNEPWRPLATNNIYVTSQNVAVSGYNKLW